MFRKESVSLLWHTIKFIKKTAQWPLTYGVHAEAWRSGWRIMRFTTGSRKPTPTVALLKNLRWIPDLNLNQFHQCPFAASSFYFLLLNLKDLKPAGTDQPRAVALTLENKPKNRYNNVLPCELTELLKPTSFVAAHLIHRPSIML